MDEENDVAGGETLVDPIWDPWTPRRVADALADVECRWYVVAGWALDLFRGEQTRDHEDIEIGVARAGFPQVRAALGDLAVDVVGSGRRWPLESPAFDVHFQTWFREPATDVYRLDVFRDPHEGDEWICRRDARIRRPYDEVVRRTDDGMPYMAPEVALLFKAKHRRGKDEADFRGAAPLLEPGARAWLCDALALVHPGHPWIDEAGGFGG